MQQRQTFIVYEEDAQGKILKFERFACKRLETVKRNMWKLYEMNNKSVSGSGVFVWKIYATPEGVHKDLEPVCIVHLPEMNTAN